MPKVLVIYDSRTGNTEEMARAVADGAREVRAEAEVKKALDTSLGDLERADAIILGSPTHFGTMSENMKRLINDSVRIRGRL
jgi:NAD(P)H dehydrogenase (quinone)